MAGWVERGPGGILGLLTLIDDHREAVEFDLLMAGLRLVDLGGSLSWWHLLVLVRRWSNQPGTALSEAQHGHRLWTVGEQLLAMAVDALHEGNWQRAGKKHAPKPKPVERPWQKKQVRRLGSGAIPIGEFDAWWESAAPRA